MKFSQFKSEIESTIQTIDVQFDDINWENRLIYGDFLAQIYYYVDHATRVLSYAAARTPIKNKLLHNEILKGIAEETDHENLAKNDLRALGFELTDFPELIETSCYYQTLYYQIFSRGPNALLAYFLPLEGLAATAFHRHYDRLKRIYAKDSLEFLEEHCILDQDHYREGLKRLESAESKDLEEISEIARYSAKIYASIIRSIKERHRQAGFRPKQSAPLFTQC